MVPVVLEAVIDDFMLRWSFYIVNAFIVFLYVQFQRTSAIRNKNIIKYRKANIL